jgi:hypothetical protein
MIKSRVGGRPQRRQAVLDRRFVSDERGQEGLAIRGPPSVEQLDLDRDQARASSCLSEPRSRDKPPYAASCCPDGIAEPRPLSVAER